MEVNEFEIPVPWGYIAAKSWGSNKNKLVLMVHGLRDNAGSFDRLIKYLPKHFYYLCIDLPGHALSSYFPQNIPINILNYVMALRLVIENTKRKKLIIIGHSWGGMLSALFTQLYPEVIEKIVLLDSVYSHPISVQYFKQFTKQHLETVKTLFEKSSKSTSPVYSYKDILKLIMRNRLYGTLNRDAAEAILKRSSMQVGNDLYVLRNYGHLRIKHYLFADMEFVVKIVKCVPSHVPSYFYSLRSRPL
ncbi:hypothetical protein FQA39_LY09587 [Lamprigera yunnana]|nr:hypothetical protein FQA39_LY09587 [Lamprigera yunnana]